MSQVTITESALMKAISSPTAATTLSPGPTLNSSGSKAALRRCCAALGTLNRGSTPPPPEKSRFFSRAVINAS
jgi:hypothetical protein